MKCCKNIKLSLKTNSAFKKAYKFQWKNVHSTVLQNAWSQKTNTLVESKISYQKNNSFHWKTILDDKKSLALHWKIIRALQRILSKRNDTLQKHKALFENQFCF